jgi:hypothetical protein
METHKLRKYVEERRVYFKEITELNSTQIKKKQRRKRRRGKKGE